MLRVLLLLIFSFELLAPSLVYGYSESLPIACRGTHILAAKSKSVDVLSQILFEENNAEERSFINCAKPVVLFEVFNKLEKFEPVNITWVLPKERYDSSPSIFNIHQVFLI